MPPLDEIVARLNSEAVPRMSFRAHLGGFPVSHARGHRTHLTVAVAAGFAIGAATMFALSWLA
ncbi:hypothetical protein [Tsuneonella amylolytica]|uniref:hypothetical protein n=1 Tax=Tsuneonella amylolytica TaxID=2338327 RepID=UPI000EA9A799|nr:hypothetical protein [Tsuneonella amylolytica]